MNFYYYVKKMDGKFLCDNDSSCREETIQEIFYDRDYQTVASIECGSETNRVKALGEHLTPLLKEVGLEIETSDGTLQFEVKKINPYFISLLLLIIRDIPSWHYGNDLEILRYIIKTLPVSNPDKFYIGAYYYKTFVEKNVKFLTRYGTGVSVLSGPIDYLGGYFHKNLSDFVDYYNYLKSNNLSSTSYKVMSKQEFLMLKYIECKDDKKFWELLPYEQENL